MAEPGFARYLRDVQKFPLLTQEEEQALARRWRDHADPEAMRRLANSHLRLVVAIARTYRGYGRPPAEITAEGNIGLLQAVARFDPDHGCRLATYATCWIRAAIMDYIMRSWSLVRLGTTGAQRKLFFNLRRLSAALPAAEGGDLPAAVVTQLARALGVRESDVVTMHRRLTTPDFSLNTPHGHAASGDTGEWLALLADDRADQETALAERCERRRRRELLREAIGQLNRQEREIVVERCLKDKATKLRELGARYAVSSERVRQIEVRALEKMRHAVNRVPTPGWAAA